MRVLASPLMEDCTVTPPQVELKGENVKVENGKIVITIPVDLQSIAELCRWRDRFGSLI